MDRERLQREMEEVGVGQEGRQVEAIQRMMDQRGEGQGGQRQPESQHRQGSMEIGGEMNTGSGVDSGGAGPTDTTVGPI